MRVGKQVIGIIVLVGLILLGAAQETPPPPQPPAPTHQDAPAPEPHPELKPLVEDIRTLLGNGKFQDALPKADELLQQAKAKGDAIGEAYALRFRALALQRTRQTAPDQLPEVASVWASALALWREIGDEALQVEALLGQAYCLWRVSPEQAQALLQDALQLAKGEAKRPLAIATALHNAGVDWVEVGQLSVAETLVQQALEIFENLVPNSLLVAYPLNLLGGIAQVQGKLEQAEQLLQQALVIRKNFAPNSLEVASTLYNLGTVAHDRGDLARAEQYYQQALAIYKTLAPNSLEVASTLNSLGVVAHARGDLDTAERYYQQALAIKERLAPNSLEVARTLNSLGIVASDRGDLDTAERYFQQALAIQEKLAPNSLEVARTLNSLGVVARARGDLGTAEQYFRQALAIYKTLAPNSLEVADILHNLGCVAFERGVLADAEWYFQQALAIREKLAPNSLGVATTLEGLGVVARARGDLDTAERYFQQVLAIGKRLAPNSLQVARTLYNLGIVASDRGDLATAEQYYQQALAIYEKLAPNSLEVATTLQSLAIFARQQKNYPQAQHHLQRALKIYETQRTTIQDPETKAAFAERYFNAYTLQAQLALDQNQPEQAALALERSRARALAETLARRALTLPADAPKALRDLFAQQEQLQREQLLLARKQRTANANDTETVRHLQAQSRQLADRQRKLDQRLRQQFPNYAELLNPQPPSLKRVQAALDANTVLLYHAFADKELLIVAVSRQAVRGYRVRVNPQQLRNDIQEFHRVVAGRPRNLLTDDEEEERRTTIVQLGRRLYRTLVQPAEPSLRGARTVLLCPEGDLNLLPWAALVVAVDKRGRPTYWIERVALALTPSAGVYLQARAVRPAGRGVALVAVSDYPGQQVAQVARRSGKALDDLSQVKEEVASIRQWLGKWGVQEARESRATPARARQIAQRARVVHFACHAEADGVDPLGSWLALAPAGAPAGKLTAGAVVGKWRLRADVVMLSGCETAVGVLRPYEGLYGLARAFLFAGARSVGASLWQVNDVSTARLMEAFYRGYASGVPKAEALRRAQVELLRRQEYSDPYYWSAFILIGAEQ
jgi:CHAT domain-containing protein/Tfp pilus assembly protein PilF